MVEVIFSDEILISNAIMNELGAYGGWISVEGGKTYLEIPKSRITITSNLKSYRYTKVGDIIRINLTSILKKKTAKKKTVKRL